MKIKRSAKEEGAWKREFRKEDEEKRKGACAKAKVAKRELKEPCGKLATSHVEGGRREPRALSNTLLWQQQERR